MSARKIMRKAGIGAALLLTVLVWTKCKKSDTVRPNYELVSDKAGFTIQSFSVSNATADFTASPTFPFNGVLSQSATWFIDLKGMSSGAQKRLSGTSNIIDNNNSAWNGGHDGLYFFRKGEKIAATLSVLGSDQTKADTFTLNQPRLFGINGNLLVGDFEANASWPDWIGGIPGFYKEDPPKPQDKDLAGILVAEGFADPVYPNIAFKPVQGTKSYRMAGLDDNGSYFVVGNRREKLDFASLPADPSQVYFNIYIFGYGDPNSKLNFGAQEDDNDGTIGVHTPADDDEFQIQISLNHVGWKLLSIKYSDMLPAPDPKNGGSGNRIHEPQRIIGVTFGLISSPARNYVAATMDYPIITVGGPFDPSK